MTLSIVGVVKLLQTISVGVRGGGGGGGEEDALPSPVIFSRGHCLAKKLYLGKPLNFQATNGENIWERDWSRTTM